MTERVALGAVVLAGVLFRVVIGVGDYGVVWPDEIYQSIEPAHQLLYGEGLLAWEYQDGARTWVLPALLAAFLGVLDVVGLDAPPSSIIGVQLLFVAIAAGTAVATYALARALDASRLAAVVGAAGFALAPPAIYFGHRALSENASALAVTAGLALVFVAIRSPERPWPRARALLWAGASLLGLAVLLRVQNGVFCAVVLGVVAVRRDWRATAHTAAAFAAWAAFMAVLDKLTWGRWLGSARTYWEQNVDEGLASKFGVEPFWYYADHLWTSMPGLLAVVGALAVLGAIRRPALLLLVLAYFLAHSTVDHKELRFMVPMLPLLFALAAVGVDVLARIAGDNARQVAVGALVALGLAGAFGADELTWGDIGSPNGAPEASAWEHFADLNRLIIEAREQDDLCGLMVQSPNLVWTGGYSYLHRRVPMYNGTVPYESGFYNYAVIAPNEQPPPGSTLVKGDRAYRLFRVADGCRPDPGYEYDKLK